MSLSDITYDSFLAYFCSHILDPVRTQVSYPMRIVPEIEDIYLTILTEAQIITWEASGYTGWVLSRQIGGVEDVRRQVPPRVFYSLASTCRT